MKKLFVLITCVLTLNTTVEAQEYGTAIGLRFGFPAGVNYKQFIGNSNSAIEVIVGGGQNGASVTALLEFHSEALDRSLNIVYGIGGHVGTWKSDVNVGADGIFGLEYKPDAPIVFSIDVKPTLYLWRSNLRFATGGAFSIRYALN